MLSLTNKQTNKQTPEKNNKNTKEKQKIKMITDFVDVSDFRCNNNVYLMNCSFQQFVFHFFWYTRVIQKVYLIDFRFVTLLCMNLICTEINKEICISFLVL